MSETSETTSIQIPHQAVRAATPAEEVEGAPVTTGTSLPLRTFQRNAGQLSLADRRRIVVQALVLLEQNYVHLPLKAAMHAVNPVQRLRVLRARLERQTPATMEAEWVFHPEVSRAFLSVRDLHTNYLLPAPFAGMVAYCRS